MNIDNQIFKEAYGQYWDTVKPSVDEEGWVYNDELPFLLDVYFEVKTKREIDREEDISGEKWYDKDKRWKGFKRWRPKELRENN